MSYLSRYAFSSEELARMTDRAIEMLETAFEVAPVAARHSGEREHSGKVQPWRGIDHGQILKEWKGQ